MNLRPRLLILIFALLVLHPWILAHAQEENSQSPQTVERARQDYLFQYANYTEAHKEYQTAKEAYQKFGTIVSQQEAIAKTKPVLILRAEILRTHLQLLKVKLASQPDLEPALKDAQFGKIEATQAFISTHKDNLQKTKSISEVNAESQRLEREADAIQDLAYESLSFLLVGEAQELEIRTRTMLENTVKDVPEEDQAIKQGASDVRRKLTSVRVALDGSTDTILKFRVSQSTRMLKAYEQVQKEMIGVKSSLQEAAQLVSEIVRSISNG